MDARAFFDMLYGDEVGAESHLIIGGKDAHGPYTSTEEAAEAAMRLSALRSHDVYFSTSLMRGARNAKDDAVVMPMLWMDLDCYMPDKQRGVPRELALGLLAAAMPPKPTLVLWSGGGFHLYWLFREPWRFKSEKERERARLLLRGFNSTVQHALRAKGYDLDSPGNLNKFMRFPGSWSQKRGCVTEFMHADLDARYNPDDLETFIADDCFGGSAGGVTNASVGARMASWDFDVADIRGDVNTEKLGILLEIDEFSCVWSGKRKFKSASERDLSLVNFAVPAKWTDAEIVALLKARRFVAGDKEKDDQYFARTIELVRRDEKPVMVPKTLDERHERVEQLRLVMQTPVVGVELRVRRDKRWYRVLLDREQTPSPHFVDLTNVLQWGNVRFDFAMHRVNLPPKNPAWAKSVAILMALAEEVVDEAGEGMGGEVEFDDLLDQALGDDLTSLQQMAVSVSRSGVGALTSCVFEGVRLVSLADAVRVAKENQVMGAASARALLRAAGYEPTNQFRAYERRWSFWVKRTDRLAFDLARSRSAGEAEAG